MASHLSLKVGLLMGVLVIPFTAHAEATLVFQTNEATATSQVVSVCESKVRMDYKGGDADSYFLFDSTRKQITIVTPAKRTYLIFNRAKIQALQARVKKVQAHTSKEVGKAMEAARAKMQERMKTMKPEQRKLVEQMMAKMGQPRAVNAPAPEMKPKLAKRVVKTNRSRKVRGIPCRQVELYRGEEKRGEACVASPKKLGLSSNEFTTLKAMFATFGELGNAFKRNKTMLAPKNESLGLLDKLQGIPIEFSDTGENEGRSGLASVVREKKNAAYFEIPPGFVERDLLAEMPNY